MPDALNRRFFLAGCAVVVGTMLDAAPSCFAAEPSVDPRLKAIVDKHLHIDPNYQPGDLLSRGNVEPIFNELIELGIQPIDATDGLYGDYLRDGDYLVQLLRSTRGRAFMRQAAALPGAYDRLERLSWLPVGRSWLQQLIAAENGPELFAAMLTEQGMKTVEESLQDDPSGRNFRLPTGHVHTETELLARLQSMLNAQSRKSAKAK